MAADFYTPVDSESIPTGEVLSVKGTAFDFTKPRDLSSVLTERVEGIDHNFALRSRNIEVLCANLRCESSGRELTIFTKEPGLQVYTGNFLTAEVKTRRGPSEKYGAICLETQQFPDFVNHTHFPGFFAEPGVPYRSETIYEISVS